MKRAATRSKVTTPVAESGFDKLAQIADAKTQFMSAAINMSWQLAVTIIVPVIIGVKLDDHYHSSPSWTLTALFLAVFMAGGVVYKSLRGVSATQVSNNKGKKS